MEENSILLNLSEKLCDSGIESKIEDYLFIFKSIHTDSEKIIKGQEI